MEAATGDSDGKIADSDSGELLIEVVHLSVRTVKNCDGRLLLGLYHETFHIREDGENFFSHRGLQGPLDRLTRFSAVGENAAHGRCHSIKTNPDSALSRPPRSPLHMVPGADEEASRRRQAVRPLYLPEVRLSAHNQARPKTTQPHTLAGCGKTIRTCSTTGELPSRIADRDDSNEVGIQSVRLAPFSHVSYFTRRGLWRIFSAFC